MKYTHENIMELLTNYNKLQDEIAKFVNRENDQKKNDQKKNHWYSTRLNHENLTIEREENTNGDYYPQYDRWVKVSTIEQFLEWYEKQQVTENTQKA